MLYSTIGFVSFIVCFVVNSDIFFKNDSVVDRHSLKSYRIYIIVLMLFFLSGATWGILDHFHLVNGLYVTTYLYLFLMAASLVCWTRFVTFYLEKRRISTPLIMYTGTAIFLFVLAIIIANFFTPVLFSINEDASYHAHYLRYAYLTFQLTLSALTGLFAFIMSFRRKGDARRRYLSIASFGIIMVAAILLQLQYFSIPFYMMGCTIGVTAIHSFVVESEKRSYRHSLEKQAKDLSATIEQLNTDALTGAKSRTAYVHMEEELDRKISFKEIEQFAVVVFDLNGLKRINDEKGHDFGDKYLVDCYQLITSVYKDCPVYRFGGDEFVAFLKNDCFNIKEELLKLFEKKVDGQKDKEYKLVISSGMADFNPETDNTLKAVFNKADKKMYKRKQYLKEAMGQ